jgi:hypothetical protein
MNYLPLAGGGFYGAVDKAQMASFYCSWGLLETAPTISTGIILLSDGRLAKKITDTFYLVI